MVFFGFPTEIQKTQGFLGFFTRDRTRKPKKHCFFFGFPPKIQKNHVIFWISVGKPKKTLGKPTNPKVSGPSERFWIFGFLVSAEGTTKPKIPKIQTLLRGPKLLDFLVFLGFFLVFQQKSKKTHGVFWFSNRNPKKHRVFGVFHPRPNKRKPKSTVFFLVFHLKSKKNHVIFWISVGKPKKTLGKPKIQKFRAPQFGLLVFGFPRRNV